MTGKDEALLRAGYEPCTSAEVAGLLTPKLAMKEEEYVRILHMSYRSWRDLRVDLREKLRERMAGGVRAKKYIEDPKGNVARSRGNRMRYRQVDLSQRDNEEKRLQVMWQDSVADM